MKRALALAMALLPAAARGQDSLRPEDVLLDIERRGQDAVRGQLYNDEARWQQVVRGVESGSAAWLGVAQKLKGLRGDVSEELTIAVSRALARSARNVLSILNLAFDADDVCSLNTLESSLGEEYQAALREVERRERAVVAVADPALATPQRECLAFLRELKRDLVRNRAEWFLR